MQSISTWWMWVVFLLFILLVLAIDLVFLGGKKEHTVSIKEALIWTIVWVSCALIFNLLLWYYLKYSINSAITKELSLQFFTGYLIEKSLSVDNMFVFLYIFRYFLVPPQYQRRVLLYGILCALIFRFVAIFAGVWLINQLHWVLYLFGVLLLFSGIKMLFVGEKPRDLSQNFILRWLKSHLRLTENFHQEKFFIIQNKLIYFTPLFLVLIFIELSDIVFALDSLPAIFAISNDPFIIFTSNIFAILGLRALYFLLVSMEAKFHLLKYGIALILTFIGGKMLIHPWLDIPIPVALSIVAAILATSVILSLLLPIKRMK